MNAFCRFLLAAAVLAAAVRGADICNNELLFSYGVQSPQYLNQSSLICQSGASETCCSNNDLSWILERWNDDDRKHIQPFYELTVWLFQAIFQYYEDVILSAKYAYINPKTETSCRQSAEYLILNYMERDDMVSFINSLGKTFQYLSDIRRGFFCSLCSVKNQKYFDTTLKKVVLSYDTCTSLVQNTLQTVALRINKVMPILANINALLNCQLPDQPHDQDLFTMKEARFFAANRCFNAQQRLKSEDGVFAECRDWCSDFSLVEASESFEGLLKPLVVLKDKLALTKITPTDPIWPEVHVTEHYGAHWIRDHFFEADLSFQDMSKFEVIFEEFGLSLATDAKTSLFSFSPDTGMSSLLMGGTVLKAVVAGVLAWVFK